MSRKYFSAPISTSEKYLIRFSLQFLDCQLTAGMGLQLRVKPVEFLHTGFTCSVCLHAGTEFLKVNAYPVERKAGLAVRTFDPAHI